MRLTPSPPAWETQELDWYSLYFEYQRRLNTGIGAVSAGPKQRGLQYGSWHCSVVAQHHRHSRTPLLVPTRSFTTIAAHENNAFGSQCAL